VKDCCGLCIFGILIFKFTVYTKCFIDFVVVVVVVVNVVLSCLLFFLQIL